jgi:ribosomal protein S3AE
MAKPKVRKTGKGAPKKKWVEILAPKVFNQQPVGQTYVYETREALGKPITANLMSLTKNHRRQGTNVMFEVTGQHEDKLITEFTGLRIMPPVVRRMVRRGKEKIEDSFICSTSDGKKVRVKPIIVTRAKAKGSVVTSMRKAAKLYLARTFSKMAYDQIVESLVDYKLQKGIYETLIKIYPVSVCEIRWFALLKEKGHAAAEKKPAEAKKEEKPKAEAEA